MKYEIRDAPALDVKDFECPCNPFVESIGSCACFNIKQERKQDVKGCLMFDDNKRSVSVYAYEKGKIVERKRKVSPSNIKAIDDMKLERSEKSQNLTNRIYVHNLKS